MLVRGSRRMSSSSTTTECCSSLGVSERVARFVLPIGCTINMDGGALEKPLASRGEPPKVVLTTEQRRGHHVTLIAELTSYSIDPYGAARARLATRSPSGAKNFLTSFIFAMKQHARIAATWYGWGGTPRTGSRGRRRPNIEPLHHQPEHISML